MVPEGVLLAALSGINTRADVERFQAVGAQAVLVGESLMAAADPSAKVRELVGA
jgi:indole-3-glycerol phosphate synthase